MTVFKIIRRLMQVGSRRENRGEVSFVGLSVVPFVRFIFIARVGFSFYFSVYDARPPRSPKAPGSLNPRRTHQCLEFLSV